MVEENSGFRLVSGRISKKVLKSGEISLGEMLHKHEVTIPGLISKREEISLWKGDTIIASVVFDREEDRRCRISMIRRHDFTLAVEFRNEYGVSPSQYFFEELVKRDFRVFAFNELYKPGDLMARSFIKNGFAKECPWGFEVTPKGIEAAKSRKIDLPREPIRGPVRNFLKGLIPRNPFFGRPRKPR